MSATYYWWVNLSARNSLSLSSQSIDYFRGTVQALASETLIAIYKEKTATLSVHVEAGNDNQPNVCTN